MIGYEPILGVAGGIIMGIILLMLITPIFVGYYRMGLNQPGGDKPSGIHFFTLIEPGQVKTIVRGDSFVRNIMDTPGLRFAQEGKDKRDAPYWEIVDIKKNGGKSTSPVTDVFFLLRPWAWYVFVTTGAVFTGIYPFQRVREYKLEHIRVTRYENKDNPTSLKSNLILESVTNYSDHHRCRVFLFPMHITGAETKDKIPLDIIGTAKCITRNAVLASFGTDDWSHLLVNLATNAINRKTKQTELDKVLTASSEEEAKLISQAVCSIDNDADTCGMDIIGFDTLEINPDLDHAGLTKIQSEALSKQEAKGIVILGNARAQALRATQEATQSGGEHALAAIQADALVRAAESAGKGGGMVILTPPTTNTNPLDAAILAQLKKEKG